MSKQAENAQAGAAAMARATYSRKAGEHESNKQSQLNEIRESEMQEEIENAMRINVNEYADWDF